MQGKGKNVAKNAQINTQGSRIGRSYATMAGNISKKDQAIVARIVGEFVDISRKNIKTWRQGLEAASDPDNPRWTELQDLYDYLLPDGHLGSQIGIRKGAILSNRFFIRDGKTTKENQDKTKMLEKMWFFNLIGDLLDYIPRAYTVVQFPDPQFLLDPKPLQDVYYLVPRRNFIPQKNMVLLKTSGDEGVLITDPAYLNTIICIKNQEKFGILNDLVPGLIWKKNARQAWAEFGEKFGLPLVKVTTNKTSKTDLDKMEYMAAQMAQAARAILPMGTTMDIVDTAAKGDPYKVFLEQMVYTDNEVSKRFLGGTMISDNGSSRSQSEVHERTLDDKISEMDRKNMEFVVNDQLMPYLISIGYGGFMQGDEFAYDRSQSLSIAEQWKIVNEALSHYTLDEAVVSETFNLPITGLKDISSTGSTNFKKPLKAVASFRGANWPTYKAASCCKPHDRFKSAGTDENFSTLLKDLQDKVLKKVFEGKPALAEYVQKGLAVGGKYREGLVDGWGQRRLDIAYNATDHRALALMEQNLFTFTQLREKASVFELNKLLIDKDGKKLNEYSDFLQAAKPHLQDLNENWLRTEYNFSVATGQTASQYHQFLSEADTVTRLLQYITAGDDRVREKHKMLNNRIFSIDDPEARRLWPPNEWGCRCEFIQYLGKPPASLMTTGKEGIALIDWNDKQAKLFGVNRGETSQVFLQNQMYMKDNGLANDVKAMTFEKYGLQKWDDIKQHYKPIKLDKSITPGNVGELFKPESTSDTMVYDDHLDRKVFLKRSVFDEHTTGQYATDDERRHQLFPKIADAIAKPDEVYLFDYRKGQYQMRYVKFYEDSVLIVPAKIGNKGLEITTWYEMKAKEQAQRTGLLIHKKP